MSLIVLLARLVLALIFMVAGFAKLADLKRSQQVLRDFGVPAVLANPCGVVLPLAEIAVAVALIPPLTAWWAGLGALALLLLFVGGIGSNLARGRQPDCHCFGQLHSAPAGWPTLIRNLVLAAVAGVVVAFGRSIPGPGVLDWLAPLSVSQRLEVLGGVLLLALLFGEGWLLVQTMSQHGRLLLRLEALEGRLVAEGTVGTVVPTETSTAPRAGLPVGVSAPGFALSTSSGETMTLEALRGLGKPVLLLFSDPGCGSCNALLPEVARWRREHASTLVVVLISRGTVEATHPNVSASGLTQMLLQKDHEVAQAYQVAATPSGVLVRPDGTIGSPLAQGGEAIRALVASAVGLPALPSLPNPAPLGGNGHGHGALPLVKQPASVAASKVGLPAPAFSLPDLSGQMVALSDFWGDKTLLLFWRPSCGFCQRMLPDLKAWEAHQPKGAPRLLVVSTDSVADNQAMGLRSPVLLDQDGMRVGRLFGATGTPMAVLVDEEGKIASQLATGALAVLALAGQQQNKVALA